MLKEKAQVKKLPESRYKRIADNDSGIKLILPYKIIICAVISFVLADAFIGGARSPLVISFAGVLPPLLGAASFIGSMLSFLVHGTLMDSVSAMTAMLALIIAKVVICDFIKKTPSSGAKAFITGAACFGCEIIVSFSMKLSIIIVAAMLCRGVLCGLVTYFLDKTMQSAGSDGCFTLNSENIVSSAVIYVLMICAMGSISFGYLNIGRILGIAVILIGASRLAHAGGAVSAVLTSFGIVLASADLGKAAVLLSCAALAAGLFCHAGKLSVTLVFVASNLIGIVMIGVPAGSQKFAADIIFGVILFLLIPEKLYIRVLSGIAHKQPSSAKIITSRLDFAAKTLKDVRQSALLAGKAFERRMGEDDISSKVCHKVCSNCRNSTFCGESDFHRTISYFSSAEALINVKGYLLEKDLPKGLENCTKKDELIKCFNEMYRQSQLEKKYADTSGFMRDVSLEQLTASEEILKNIKEGMTEFSGNDDGMAEKIKLIFLAYGAKNPIVSVSYDSDSRVYIEVFAEGMLKSGTDVLTKKLCLVFDRELSVPEITRIEKTMRLCFHEAPEYLLDIGIKKINGKEKTSGDSELVFSDGRGCTYFIISDGMGSGARAAVESCMTVALLKKLLQGGIGFDAAFRLINLILLTKSPDEIFATIDLLCVNSFTGQTDILKLGAAQTFIKTNGSVKCVESFSTPVGILSSIEFEHRTAYLSDGDCAVMISDGIEENCFLGIKELMMTSGISAEKCAEKIIEKASDKGSDSQDDKTVFVIKVTKI